MIISGVLFMVKISSINCNGARNNERRRLIFELCDADIVCLQETHWDEVCVRECGREWRGEMFVSNGGLRSAGVAILVKKDVVEKVRECVNDGEGRMVGIKFEHKGRTFQLINVYAHNNERDRKGFFESLSEVCGEGCIIAGDFNVWCERIDMGHGLCFRSDVSREALQKLKRENEMIDVWRERNPIKRGYSRAQMVEGKLKQSRIDMILVSKNIENVIDRVEYKINGLSDHSVIRCILKEVKWRRGGGIWCLNNEMLKERGYKEMMVKCLNDSLKSKMVEEDTGRWWVELKEVIKGKSIHYSRERGRRAKELEQRVRLEMEKESREMENGWGDARNYIRLKEELKGIERRKCMGAIVRSKVKCVMEGEKCTRFFLGLEKRRQEKTYLDNVEDKEGNVIEGMVGIATRVEGFYRELFKEEKIEEKSLRRVVGNLKRRLSDDDREICERDITKMEIGSAIKGLNRNKSPGMDGITGEFYIEFQEQMIPIMGMLYERMECNDKVEKEISLGLVSMIYKKGSKGRLENYRPLTMLNVDYKILARVIAGRLKNVIDKVVGDRQAYSIPGRSIIDTICSIRDIMEYMRERKGGIVLSLDLNKAFDRVNHRYLFEVLRAVGFGVRMRAWIARMYRGACSCVKVNGLITDTFRIERSVRQGCPMSALLYAIVAEPLAMLLEGESNIRGIKTVGDNVSLIFQYADDTTVTVQDRNSVYGVLECMEEYGRASGARVNIDKSEIMYMNENEKEKAEVGLRERKDYIRVLGINVGIEDRRGREIQYDEIIGGMRKVFGLWKNRKLGLRGKVVVINSLVLSKLIYVMNVVEVPEEVIKKINEMIKDFLWEGRGVRIARDVLENEYGEGGLKLINLENRKKALRVRTMTQYIKGGPQHLWKVFLKEMLTKVGGCGESGIFMRFRREMLGEVSGFYREVMEAWGEFLESVQYECVSVRQVWEQPLFLNKNIKVGDKAVYDRMMWRAGFRTIRDIVYEYVPGFMGGQVIVDEVEGKGFEMGLKAAEKTLNDIKRGMPDSWRRMIEVMEGVTDVREVEMQVGDNVKKTKVVELKTRVIYKLMNGRKTRRPAAERVWKEVFRSEDMSCIWENLRVKGNNCECESFDFLLRHNRVFNNLIISKFDVTVNKECDVCGVEVETFMHEFCECRELEGFFWKLRDLIRRCWGARYVERMGWKKLWLFGVNEYVRGHNKNLLNYVLSHGRYAVKMRRNYAHYEGKQLDVWDLFACKLKFDLGVLNGGLGEEEFIKWFVEGSTLIRVDGGVLKVEI